MSWTFLLGKRNLQTLLGRVGVDFRSNNSHKLQSIIAPKTMLVDPQWSIYDWNWVPCVRGRRRKRKYSREVPPYRLYTLWNDPKSTLEPLGEDGRTRFFSRETIKPSHGTRFRWRTCPSR
jgi:hypothetical protein